MKEATSNQNAKETELNASMNFALACLDEVKRHFDGVAVRAVLEIHRHAERAYLLLS
jgi:hypothetical protein